MAILHFPRLLLREKSHGWNLRGVASNGAQNAASVLPIVRSDGGGFWSAVMNDVSLSGPGRGRQRQKIATLLWRAVRTIMNGGVNAMVVWCNDALFRPWPDGVSTEVVDVPHSDGALFSDGTGYYTPVIDVTSDGGANLRATVMDIEINNCGDLVGGERFSIDHPTMGWRLYEISTVETIDATHATIRFLPPLREAVDDGAALEFDRPRCIMRLTHPGAMDLVVVPWTFNQASCDLVEAFPEAEE